jgi:hypothetical protein
LTDCILPKSVTIFLVDTYTVIEWLRNFDSILVSALLIQKSTSKCSPREYSTLPLGWTRSKCPPRVVRLSICLCHWVCSVCVRTPTVSVTVYCWFRRAFVCNSSYSYSPTKKRYSNRYEY